MVELNGAFDLKLLEARKVPLNRMLTIIIYVFGWNTQLFFRGHAEICLESEAFYRYNASDCSSVCFKMLYYLYEIFYIFKVFLLHDKRL